MSTRNASIARTPGDTAIKRAYRQWLIEQVPVEVANGCSRLFAIRGSRFYYFHDVVRDWPSTKIASLLRARIKQRRIHKLGPLELTPDEHEVADAFAWPASPTYSTPGRPQVLVRSQVFTAYPGTLLSVDADLARYKQLKDQIIRREFKVKRPDLKRKVLASVSPILGKPFNLDGERLFWNHLPGLTVETEVDLSGRVGGPLQYWHSVYRGEVNERNRGSVDTIMQVSFGDLLGNGGIATTWDYLTDDDVDSTAALLAQLIADFLQAFSGIVRVAQDYEEREP